MEITSGRSRIYGNTGANTHCRWQPADDGVVTALPGTAAGQHAGRVESPEAQAVLGQQAFGVVITDYFMPSGDGLALLRYIHQTVPGTRGIFMTAFRTPALCQQALAEGAYACLAKPFRLQELWTSCSRPYGTSQRQRQRRISPKRIGIKAWEGKKTNHEGKGRGERSGVSACGRAIMTVVPSPGVLSKYIVPW